MRAGLSNYAAILTALLIAAAPAAASERGRPPQEEIRRLAQQSQARSDRWEARDRAELVRPAPPGYKPPFKGKKVVLRLIPRDKILRPGQEFWYRLELTNAGTKPIWWSGDEGAFFKTGHLQPGGKIRFFVIDEAGRRQQMLEPEHGTGSLASDIRLPAGWTKEQRAEFIAELNDPRRNKLDIELRPGETLVSRGGPDPSDEEEIALIEAGKNPATFPRGPYRTLNTRYTFQKPGRYRLQVTMENPPPPRHWSESYPEVMDKWVFGVLRSEFATIEVRP